MKNNMDELAILKQTNDFKSEANEQISLIKSFSTKEKAEILPQVTYDRLVLQKYKEIQDITINRVSDERDNALEERDIYKNELEKFDAYNEENVKNTLKSLRKNKPLIVSNERTKKNS
jgi:hypothetical protein